MEKVRKRLIKWLKRQEYKIKVPSYEDFKEEAYKMFGKDPKKFYDSAISDRMLKKVKEKIRYKDVYPKK